MRAQVKNVVDVLKETGSDWIDDKAPRLAALGAQGQVYARRRGVQRKLEVATARR